MVELVSVEEIYLIKELKVFDIMVISGKIFEEVIEDYEERINEEFNYFEKEVSFLKEKFGKDFFYIFFLLLNIEGELF